MTEPFIFFGVELGVTQVKELERRGFVCEKKSMGRSLCRKDAYRGLQFWDTIGNGIIDHIYMVRTLAFFSSDLKNRHGFDWENSYIDWINVFSRLRFNIEETKPPKQDYYDKRNVLSAEFLAKSDSYNLTFRMNFNYGNRNNEGCQIDSPGTIYGITVDQINKTKSILPSINSVNYSINKPKVNANKIFISYRRRDSAAAAGRLYDFLERELGTELIFKDVDNIPYGKDFKEEIRKAIDNSKVVLVIIGRDFIDSANRLFQENDYVRYEIAYAIQTQKIVIPVIVNDSSIPSPTDLPDGIKKIATINGPELRNTRWKRDCEDFLDHLKKMI